LNDPRQFRLEGLVAAAHTPLNADRSVNLDRVPDIVDHLEAAGVSGLYVLGSTGEGISLSGQERRAVAEAYAAAAAGRLPVIVQVGHNSLAEARELAAHAQAIGADAVSANAPSYFTVDSVPLLVDCMAEAAAGAPALPFYYYHIPRLTGAVLDMVAFLQAAAERIPTLAGIKYSTPTVHEYQACLELESRRFDVLWGSDEMLLSALAVGGRGAVGSTYNIAAPLYRRLIEAFEAGDLAEARRCQARSVALCRCLYRYPFHPALKAVMNMLGVDAGPCRLPLPPLSPQDEAALKSELDSMGFFEMDASPVSSEVAT
jgi:N-acetylneuraminate lyase